MGQSAHKESHANSKWQPLGNSGRFQIYKNQNNELAQKHVIPNNPKLSQSDELAAYYERYLPNRPLVNAYSAEFQNNKKGFCSHSQNITAFIQYIPHRLSNIKKLSHGQGMYVLSESLAGFSYLHKKFGAFPVNQDLIGFNKDGEVRVWNNPNFAQNHLDNDMVVLMSTINPYDFDSKFSKQQQYDMVQDTFNAVSRHANFSPDFLQKGLHLQKLGFPQARTIVAQQIDRKMYYVPDHLNLSDKDGILHRSGIQSKYRSSQMIYNENNQNRNSNGHFINRNNNEDVEIEYINGNSNQNNGTYNLNGQNYRIIQTRVVDDGQSQNESQLVRRALSGQHVENGNYVQHQNHHSNNYLASNTNNVMYVSEQPNAHQPSYNYINSSHIPANINHNGQLEYQNNRQQYSQPQNVVYQTTNNRATYETIPSRLSPYDPINARTTYRTSNTPIVHSPSQQPIIVTSNDRNLEPHVTFNNGYTGPTYQSVNVSNRNIANGHYINNQIQQMGSPRRHKTIFDSHYRATRANNQLARSS